MSCHPGFEFIFLIEKPFLVGKGKHDHFPSPAKRATMLKSLYSACELSKLAWNNPFVN